MIRFSYLLVLTLGLSATAAAETVRYGMVNLPSGEGNPFTMIGPSGTMVWSALFDGLTAIEEDGSLQPALATSWTQEGSLSWRFALRQDVSFSDGSPFTAAAVTATFNWLIGEEGRTTFVGRETNNIKAVEALSDHDVRVLLHEPDAILPIRMSLPLIVEPKKWADLGPLGFARAPVGTGSFLAEEWSTLGKPLRLRANDRTWRPPLVDEVIITVIPQAVSRAQALLTEQVDVVESIAFDDIDLLQEAGLRVLIAPTSQVMSLGFINTNAQSSPLHDVRVRHALNFAVDKETIALGLTNGITTPTAQAAVPGMLGYNPSVTPFDYDPDRARTLLSEAGYPDGFPLSIDVVVGGFVPADAAIYQKTAEDLRRIGVDVTLNAIPVQVHADKYLSNGDRGSAGAVGMSFQGRPFGDPLRAMKRFSCLVFAPFFCDPTLVPLLNQAETSATLGEREALLKKIAVRYKEVAPALFLLQQAEVIGVSPRLANARRRNRTLVLHEIAIKESAN